MPTKHEYKFDSIHELMAAISVPPTNARNNPNQVFHDGQPHWMCEHRATTSAADAKRHMEAQLFPEGVELVEALAKEVSAPTPVSRRRKAVRGPEGDELDMGRVWQGDLEHAWRLTRREQSVGPSRVLVCVQINASSFVRARDLAWRGATALAYTSALLEAGFVVELVACSRNHLLDGKDTPYSADVTLLPAGSQLDVHKLASLVASGLLFRGVILPHELTVSEHKLDGGVSTNRGALTRDQVDGTGFDYVACIGEGQQDKYGAEHWLKTNIEALDVHKAA